MAKFNITFNNTTYSIDESALDSASTALKSHLSTIMSGSGATINIDGMPYSIDATKLASETSDFVANLGTIAGSGHKVVVGGVEYSVDSGKVAGVISDLQDAFEELESNSVTYSEGLRYTLNNDKGSYAVSSGTCTDTNIVIPSSYDGLPVTSINDYGFYGKRMCVSITIPESIVSFGNMAFDQCTGIQSIIFEGTVAQWELISKNAGWNLYILATYVQCTDGQVAL